MKEDIKREWTARLRSGRYQQGQGYLATRTNDEVPAKFCCLGVLCEIAVENGVIERAFDSVDKGVLIFGYGGGIHALPEEVCEWAGLMEDDPCIVPSIAGKDSLAAFNDNGGGFPEIADIIDEWL